MKGMSSMAAIVLLLCVGACGGEGNEDVRDSGASGDAAVGQVDIDAGSVDGGERMAAVPDSSVPETDSGPVVLPDPECGNGMLEADEACDDGNLEDGDGCQADCSFSECQRDEQCDNGLFCDGAETCAAGVCQSGTAPSLNDAVSCTVDACDEERDMVTHVATDSECGAESTVCAGSQLTTTVPYCDAVTGCASDVTALGCPVAAPTCDGNDLLTYPSTCANAARCATPSESEVRTACGAADECVGSVFIDRQGSCNETMGRCDSTVVSTQDCAASDTCNIFNFGSGCQIAYSIGRCTVRGCTTETDTLFCAGGGCSCSPTPACR